MRIIVGVLALWGMAAGAAVPVFAKSSTTLMLDTGGHMALIKDIVFTPDGKQLVSASDDKTIRVWDLASGKTVRTIRGEVGRGIRGNFLPWRCRPMANGWLL